MPRRNPLRPLNLLLGKQPDARHPAVQLHDASHAAATGAVDHEHHLAHPRRARSVHEEPERGPDAPVAVELVEVGPQHHLALAEVEPGFLVGVHRNPPVEAGYRRPAIGWASAAWAR